MTDTDQAAGTTNRYLNKLIDCLRTHADGGSGHRKRWLSNDCTLAIEAITRLRAELAAAMSQVRGKAGTIDKLKAELAAAVQRADHAEAMIEKVTDPEYLDEALRKVGYDESALAAERAARERMRDLLRNCPCPDPLAMTIGRCMDRGDCGCVYGDVLRPAEASAGEATGKVRHRPAYWTYDDEAFDDIGEHLYYFAPENRAPPPYLTQRHVPAIIDIAADGTLAGVELIDGMPPPPQSPARPAQKDSE